MFKSFIGSFPRKSRLHDGYKFYVKILAIIACRFALYQRYPTTKAVDSTTRKHHCFFMALTLSSNL